MQNLQCLADVVVYALKRYIHFLRDLLIGFIFVAVQYKDGAGTFGHLAESLLDKLFYFGRKQFAGFAGLQRSDTGTQLPLLVLPDVFLKLFADMQMPQMIQAFVLNHGKDIGRDIGFVAD